MSAFCSLCHRDQDTGEFFCARPGKWVERCPNFPDGYPLDVERKAEAEENLEGDNE